MIIVILMDFTETVEILHCIFQTFGKLTMNQHVLNKFLPKENIRVLLDFVHSYAFDVDITLN